MKPTYSTNDDKYISNRVNKVRRSTLIIPSNVEKFMVKAFDRCADTVQFDLEDSVPYEQKPIAREMIRELLHATNKKNTEINVRINNDPSMWVNDLDHVVFPTLDSITVPKSEDPTFLHHIDQRLLDLERERNMTAGSIKLSVLIETVAGLANIHELLSSSDRVNTVTLGNEDFSLDLGIEPSETGLELYSYYSQVIFAARQHAVMPLGMVATIADYKNVERFRQLALSSKRLGFMGSSCIHPDQVTILNDVHTPSEVEVDRARKIVSIYEVAENEGRSSCSYEGKMIDPPIYYRAKNLLNKYALIMSKKVKG